MNEKRTRINPRYAKPRLKRDRFRDGFRLDAPDWPIVGGKTLYIEGRQLKAKLESPETRTDRPTTKLKHRTAFSTCPPRDIHSNEFASGQSVRRHSRSLNWSCVETFPTPKSRTKSPQDNRHVDALADHWGDQLDHPRANRSDDQGRAQPDCEWLQAQHLQAPQVGPEANRRHRDGEAERRHR